MWMPVTLGLYVYVVRTNLAIGVSIEAQHHF